MMHDRLHRRDALRAAIGTTLAYSPCLAALAGDTNRLFKIGACDWSLGRTGQPSAMELARQIGLDGVEVSFGKPGEKFDLRSEEARRAYRQAAQENGVEIASLAMGLLNSIPYATEPETETWVQQCVEVMPKLGVKVVLLAFFGRGDIKDKPDLQREVIRRLKKVAPKAEKAGVVLGVESWLNAQEHMRILEEVASPAVQVYYDVANMHERGYDIFREIRQLGRQRICQIHCKENKSLLGQGPIDFRKVKQAIDEAGYVGWLIIESAVGPGMKMFDSYVHNQKFLRSIFPTKS